MSWIRFDSRGLVEVRADRDLPGHEQSRLATLGEIRWHAPWRRYVFAPDRDRVFDPECLREIADFCDRHTGERKAERQAIPPPLK